MDRFLTKMWLQYLSPKCATYVKHLFPFYRVIDDIYKIYVSSTNTAVLSNVIVELCVRVGYAAILTLILIIIYSYIILQ